jgi:hypothetical protein
LLGHRNPTFLSSSEVQVPNVRSVRPCALPRSPGLPPGRFSKKLSSPPCRSGLAVFQ